MNEILCIFTDPHLRSNNIDSVTKVIEEGIALCVKKDIADMVCLGDVFDSRVSQRQDVLTAWDNILEKFDKSGITLHCLRGNHDSTDYESFKSFLTPYKYHPNFNLIDDIAETRINGKTFYWIAYYSEQKWLERYNELIKEGIKKGAILFSHIAVQGSVNNDGTKVQSTIKPSLFKSFKRVYLGHYHNSQEVGTNIFHLGSLQQNNFGEDPDKGFWILTENGNVELVQSSCGQQYKKLVINLDEVDHKKATSMIKKFKEGNSDCRLRVELTGESAAVKAFDGTSFPGIDVKKKYKEVEEVEEEEASGIEKASFDDIVIKFKKFCEEHEYEYEEGIKILKKAHDGRN